MASIPKARLRIGYQEVTVDEYIKLKEAHRFKKAIKQLECIECGDEVIFAHGEKKAPYFKHKPLSEGHDYCSLYHKGRESITPESKLWKKLRDESDITFNYELAYRNGSWRSNITIPPFTDIELRINELNQTTISFLDSQLPVNNEFFSPGEIKKISVPISKSELLIKISGKDKSNNRNYRMELFNPVKQLYSTLIRTEYVGKDNSIDLTSIKSLSFKRVTGNIYTGKHYYAFCRTDAMRSKVLSLRKYNCDVKEIKMRYSSNLGYSTIYDIVFNAVNNKNEDFCVERNCNLIDKSDAVIVWPPVNEIGNYKYYGDYDKMFVAFENDSRTLDFDSYDTQRLFFRVSNINTTSFYVARGKEVQKDYLPFENEEGSDKELLDDITEGYLYKNGVLQGRLSKKEFQLKKDNSFLVLRTKLHRKQVLMDHSKQNDDEILFLIRYSRKMISFGDKEYEFLKKKDNSELINAYLDVCKETGKIKEAVYLQLME